MQYYWDEFSHQNTVSHMQPEMFPSKDWRNRIEQTIVIYNVTKRWVTKLWLTDSTYINDDWQKSTCRSDESTYMSDEIVSIVKVKAE